MSSLFYDKDGVWFVLHVKSTGFRDLPFLVLNFKNLLSLISTVTPMSSEFCFCFCLIYVLTLLFYFLIINSDVDITRI